jgi:hypothetical protein
MGSLAWTGGCRFEVAFRPPVSLDQTRTLTLSWQCSALTSPLRLLACRQGPRLARWLSSSVHVLA